MVNDAETSLKAHRFSQFMQNRHGPGWRWELAHQLASQRSRHLWRHADKLVRRAAQYLRQCNRGEEERRSAEAKYPDIAAAEVMWANPATRDQLQIMILGAWSIDAIAGRLGASLETIQAVEAYHFATRELHESCGWIHAHVIRRAAQELATRLRLAYHGGAAVARAILDSEQRVPFERAQQIADQQVLLSLKLKQALEMPLDNPRDMLKFVRAYLEHDAQTKRLALAERRLIARCEEIGKRQELTEMRIADRAQRAKRKRRAADERQRVREYRGLLRKEYARLRLEQQLARQQVIPERLASSALAQLSWEQQVDESPAKKLIRAKRFALAAA